MGHRQEWRGAHPRRRAPWGPLTLALLTGLALLRNGSDVGFGPPQPAAAAARNSAAEIPSAPGHAAGAPALPHAPASRVRLPAIKVDAPMVDVGLDREGWIEAPPPQDPNLAGWYQNGIAPGQSGTSIVVGHVDNSTGPAVFFGLGSVKKGQRVEVDRFDGRTAVFEVYGVEVYDKESFPGARVYGDTGRPELRVITCGGGYSKDTGYAGNVVVFARLVATR
ncbi:class F sortase [Streptomyces candidus]|uniref:Class F sortase n=1 Tax=Streptomyces candidus TaxID=67283 RepID=A0A7X0HM86_9ACTN|nr:class F sortase [Streptomyces candidus]MBB6438728.1 hypothetical protein [Streptomyces candidus]GHH53206.1 class F sortase [Streptomyces candidus]